MISSPKARTARDSLTSLGSYQSMLSIALHGEPRMTVSSSRSVRSRICHMLGSGLPIGRVRLLVCERGRNSPGRPMLEDRDGARPKAIASATPVRPRGLHLFRPRRVEHELPLLTPGRWRRIES